jgi:preprotein translocase subunit SecB
MNENEAGAIGVAVRVVAQYVKDLSFENPQSPGSLLGGNVAPAIEAQVDVAAKRLGDVDFESELKITVKAKRGEAVVFLVELVYGALFQIQNAPPELLEPILLIECPRLLFPFARRVIADVTRDGGFAPLLIDPIDFARLYEGQRAQREGQQPVGTA